MLSCRSRRDLVWNMNGSRVAENVLLTAALRCLPAHITKRASSGRSGPREGPAALRSHNARADEAALSEALEHLRQLCPHMDHSIACRKPDESNCAGCETGDVSFESPNPRTSPMMRRRPRLTCECTTSPCRSLRVQLSSSIAVPTHAHLATAPRAARQQMFTTAIHWQRIRGAAGLWTPISTSARRIPHQRWRIGERWQVNQHLGAHRLKVAMLFMLAYHFRTA